MSDLKKLKDTLKDEMRSHSVSAAKLAEATGISPAYIQALIENDYSKLPAAPYVRGYLVKIAEVLDSDADMLWKQYSYETQIKRSGVRDTLPQNRFALKGTNKVGIVVAVIVIAGLIYLFPRLTDFFGKPSIEIVSPSADSIVVTETSYTIAGKVHNPADRVFINETEIQVNDAGDFELRSDLQEGANAFEITVKRFLGKSTTMNRTIFYTSTSTTPLPTPSSTPPPDEEEAQTTPSQEL